MKTCSCKQLKTRLLEEEAQGVPVQRIFALCSRILLQRPTHDGPSRTGASWLRFPSLPVQICQSILRRALPLAVGWVPWGEQGPSFEAFANLLGKLWSGQSCSELHDYPCASPISGCLLVGNYQFPNVRVHKQPDRYRGYDGPRSLRSDTTNPTAKFWQYRCPAPNHDIVKIICKNNKQIILPLPKIK